MKNRLLTTKELAEYFTVHENTIYQWAKQGMPRFELSKQTRRYDLEEVTEWLTDRSKEDKTGGN